MNAFKYLLAISALTVAGTAHAITLSYGDARYVGIIIDGIPSSPAAEAGYINDLNNLAAGAGPVACGTETCDRTNSTLNIALPDVTSTGAVKDDSGGNVLASAGYDYVIGKYDAAQAGSLVWYIGGSETQVRLPTSFNGFGLSHISLFNCVGDCNPPEFDVPEPGTLALLGLGLVGLAYRRRRSLDA